MYLEIGSRKWIKRNIGILCSNEWIDFYTSNKTNKITTLIQKIDNEYYMIGYWNCEKNKIKKINKFNSCKY